MGCGDVVGGAATFYIQVPTYFIEQFKLAFLKLAVAILLVVLAIVYNQVTTYCIEQL